MLFSILFPKNRQKIQYFCEAQGTLEGQRSPRAQGTHLSKGKNML